MKKDTKKFGLLIVDDDSKWRAIYKEWLSDHTKGHYTLRDMWDSDSIKECEDGKSALNYIRQYKDTKDYHLIVIADAFMPPNCDGSGVTGDNELFGGLWLIDEVNKDNVEKLKDFVTILLVTYYDDIIKPYRNGDRPEFKWVDGEHYFFVEKPLTRSSGVAVNKAISKLSNDEVRDKLFKKTFEAVWKIIEDRRKMAGLGNIIGESEKIKKVIETINKVAPTDSKILITGESGTGKELVARAIYNLSTRKKQPFVAINCAAIPENLLESELFGCEKGAFTGAEKRIGRFEEANAGTIFLDEIGDMTPATQAKVLRVLQEGTFERLGSNTPIKVDVRVVAATNKNLLDETKKGTFREDLFYRINAIPIHMPPLRERKEDIPLLVEYFLEVNNRKNVTITSDGMETLRNHNWPGNVRNLCNIIERLVVLSSTDKITADDVKNAFNMEQTTQKTSLYDLLKSLPTFPLFEEVKKSYFQLAFDITMGNFKKAEEITGVSDDTVKKYVNGKKK